MSKLVRGLPGIVMAVTHLVCALSGAPGPTHPAAAAGEDGTSVAAPSNAVATVPEKYASNLPYLVMRSLPLEEPFPHKGSYLTIEHLCVRFQPIRSQRLKDGIFFLFVANRTHPNHAQIKA